MDAERFAEIMARAIPITLITSPVVYHGTPHQFDTFVSGINRQSRADIGTFSFSSSIENARTYLEEYPPSGQLIKATLSFKRLLVRDAEGRLWKNINGGNGDTGSIRNPAFDGCLMSGERGPSGQALFMEDPRGPIPYINIQTIAFLASLAGYDGLLVKNVIDPGCERSNSVQDTWITFSADQITVLDREIVEPESETASS